MQACPLLIALTLLVPTPVVFAAPVGPQAQVQPSSVIDEADRAYRAGQARYDTSDYEGAIEEFTRAYQLMLEIDDPDARAAIGLALFFNMARAHTRAYDLDLDTSHLRAARELVDRYEAAGGEDAQGIAEIRREIEDRGSGPPSEIEASRPDDLDHPDKGARQRPPGRGLTILGGVSLGATGAIFGVGIAGLVLGGQARSDYADGPTRADRDAATGRGGSANTLAIVGMVVGGVGLATGVTLIVLAVKKNRTRPAKTLAFSAKMRGHSLSWGWL